MSTSAVGDATKTQDLSEDAVATSAMTDSGTAAQGSNAGSDTKEGVTQSFPPSHILEDGRLIYLPPPNAAERSRFFERSIARHGILQADMERSDHSDDNNEDKTKQDVQNILGGDKEDQQKETDDEDNKKDSTAPKIHPLAVASARIQSNGLNELNRAINLATLVTSGEFFSYTNVVDPSYETDATATVKAAATKAGGDKSSSDGGAASSGTASSSAAAAYYSAEATAQRTEALFSLKRKRAQFEKASEVLYRHEQRLWAGVQAQHVIDQRLFQLRQQWRLVAPEHGTRARLHAARTNEVIAVDVDVYDRDRVHGGNQALMNGGNRTQIGLAGRLASRVPRFATIELRDTFRVLERKNENGDDDDNDADNEGKNDSSSSTAVAVGTTTTAGTKKSPPRDEEMKDAVGDGRGEEKDTHNENERKKDSENQNENNDDDDDVVMRDSPLESKNKDNEALSPRSTDKVTKEAEDERYAANMTRAEPFAVADPTLGRVIENFDPSKIPMLNLQLDIQKSTTGFLQSACLEPMTTLSSASLASKQSSNKDQDADNENNNNNNDEELLISLQHSLFCANLFESMRSELDPDSTNGGFNDRRGQSFSVRRPKAVQTMAWLASESEENFVAPPSFLVGSHARRSLGALSVVHCHEGEVKVQLDSEYQLCLKLVEANAEQNITSQSQLKSRKERTVGDTGSVVEDVKKSGSQSPAQLHAFCRAILLYAQDVYHRHSLYLHEREKKKREDEKAKGDGPRGLARIKKEDAPEKAQILQSCVSLGSKLLFEQRIRKTLSSVSKWLEMTYGEKLTVEWLSLSMFDLHSKFTICCRELLVDGVIARDALTITRVTEDSEDYRKVHFHTEKEFEMYMKLELRRQM